MQSLLVLHMLHSCKMGYWYYTCYTGARWRIDTAHPTQVRDGVLVLHMLHRCEMGYWYYTCYTVHRCEMGYWYYTCYTAARWGIGTKHATQLRDGVLILHMLHSCEMWLWSITKKGDRWIWKLLQSVSIAITFSMQMWHISSTLLVVTNEWCLNGLTNTGNEWRISMQLVHFLVNSQTTDHTEANYDSLTFK